MLAQSTIPIVYHNGVLLGGFDATAAFLAPAGANAEANAVHDAMIKRIKEVHIHSKNEISCSCAHRHVPRMTLAVACGAPV